MILKYRKQSNKYTTFLVIEPDYNLLDTGNRVTELCTLDGYTYISIPDALALPDQPKEVVLEKVDLTDKLKEQIKAASPDCISIKGRVVDKIRSRYTLNDELKCLRTGDTEVYNSFVEECRALGQEELKRLGL